MLSGSRTDACPVPILGINMDLRSCKPKALPRDRSSIMIELIRNWRGDNFPATYFIILKAGLRFVTSLRSDKTGTSFSLAANSI